MFPCEISLLFLCLRKQTTLWEQGLLQETTLWDQFLTLWGTYFDARRSSVRSVRRLSWANSNHSWDSSCSAPGTMARAHPLGSSLRHDQQQLPALLFSQFVVHKINFNIKGRGNSKTSSYFEGKKSKGHFQQPLKYSYIFTFSWGQNMAPGEECLSRTTQTGYGMAVHLEVKSRELSSKSTSAT